MAQTNVSSTSGFPVGYFIIKSAATGRVFDVYLDEIDDGTGITLSPEKEKSIVESEFTICSKRVALKKLEVFEILGRIIRYA